HTLHIGASAAAAKGRHLMTLDQGLLSDRAPEKPTAAQNEYSHTAILPMERRPPLQKSCQVSARMCC
uniref:hypothetical protein n=1 Tax=Nocardia farcinica TaxID=37329 RepID=UPI002455A522